MYLTVFRNVNNGKIYRGGFASTLIFVGVVAKFIEISFTAIHGYAECAVFGLCIFALCFIIPFFNSRNFLRVSHM